MHTLCRDMFISHMMWHSHTVHNSSTTSFQSHTGNWWKSGIMQCKVSFSNCAYLVIRVVVIYLYFHLKVFNCNFMTFINIHLGTCNWQLIPKICHTSIVVDIQTHSKHVFGVVGVDVVSLQYVYSHHDDSNSFSDTTQFSVLQAAWGKYVCYSSWSSSQFYVDIMLSSCSPV